MKNIFSAKDNTYNHLKRIIKDPNLVVVSRDKSCVVIMNKIDYQNKLHEITNDGIQKGIYKEKKYKMLDDL